MGLNYKIIEDYAIKYNCTRNQAIKALKGQLEADLKDVEVFDEELVKKEEKAIKKRSTKEFKGIKLTK